MADTLNTFEGGTNAATITVANSGGSSGTAFQFVSATATYTNVAYRGALAGRFATGGTAAISYAEYTTTVGGSSSGALYLRMRFRLPVLPADATGVRVAVITDSTGAFLADLRVANSGAVSIRGSGGTALATFALSYAADTWWDVGLAITTFSATVGQIEGRRYDSAGSVAQTITSAANQNTLAAGGTNKCQVGMLRSTANYAVLVDDVAWSTTAYQAPPVAVSPSVQYGPWSGGVTDSGFTVAYVLGSTLSARLVVSTASDLSTPTYSSAAAPDASGVVKLAVTGLTANTQYYCGVETDGALLTGGRGEVRTFPTAGTPANFSVAFGSCLFTVPTATTFAQILARTGAAGQRALQLLFMGDMSYADWTGAATATDVFNQHMTSLGSTSMSGMLAKIPINYLWDNHDWGGDTSDSTAAAGNTVAAVYRQVYPTYPLPATNGRGGYHSWVIGRVRFIQLDVRSYRDPQGNAENSTKTMLGAEQKAWFKARLSDPQPVKVVCGNYPWRDDGNGSGRWGSYSDEFTELSDYIAANAPGRVYVIFGDRHYLAADDGSGSNTRGIPQAGGAPFQQSTVAVADTWSAGSYTVTPATLQAYGWLDFADDGHFITVGYKGTTSADATDRVTMTTVLAGGAISSGSVTGAGTAALTAVSDAVRDGAPAAAGVGALTATATVIRNTTVTAAGVGAVTAASSSGGDTAAPLSGSGQLSVTTAVVRSTTVTAAGVGGLASGPAKTTEAFTDSQGTGAMTATSSLVTVTMATFNGFGDGAANTSNTSTGPADMAGVGGLFASAVLNRDDNVFGEGTGALTITAELQRGGTAVFAGEGGSAIGRTVDHAPGHVDFHGSGDMANRPRIPAFTATARVLSGASA